MRKLRRPFAFVAFGINFFAVPFLILGASEPADTNRPEKDQPLIEVGRDRDRDSSTLLGSVSSVQGIRLPGAIITLTHRESGQKYQVISGDKGLYRADGLPAGTYQLTLTLPGFEGQSIEGIAVSRTTARSVDLVVPAKLSHQEVVTVISEAPGDSVEYQEIRESPARDVGEALSRTAGVWKLRKGGIANDLVLRGFQGRDINVLIDGQRVYGACPNNMDPAGFHVDFAEVDRIDIGKGPFDMKNQGSLGGAVSIITRTPRPGWHFGGTFGVGNYGFVNPSITASHGGEKFSFLGGYSFRRSDPYSDGSGRRFTELTNYLAEAVQDDAFRVSTGWGKIGWRLGKQHSFQVSYARQEADHVYYPYLAMDAVFDDTDRLGFRYEVENVSGALRVLSFQGYYTEVAHWMTDHYRSSGTPTPRGYSMGTMANTRTLGGKAEARGERFTFGLEAFERFWGTATEMAKMQYQPQWSLPDVSGTSVGLYAEYVHPLSENLDLSGGLRVDRVGSNADKQKANTDLYFAYHGTRKTAAVDSFPSGQLRVEWESPVGLRFAAGLGSTMQVPEASERYFALKRMGSDWVGNPELKPSRNTGLDSSLALERSGVYLEGTLFHNWVDNFVTLLDRDRINEMKGVMNSHARSYANIDARLWGGELTLVCSLTDFLFLTGDLSYVRGTRDLAPETGILSVNLPEIPPLRARLGLRYDNGRVFAGLEGIASSAQRAVAADLGELSTPGYGVVNLLTGIRRGRVGVTAGLDNLFDRMYLEHLSFQRDPFRSGVRVPEPGRNLFVNVAYRF
jgi:iron complex outermembrane recepter protein